MKTTACGKMPELYGDQLNSGSFVQTRLNTAATAEGEFRISREKAIEIQQNIGKKYVVEEVNAGAKGRRYVANMKQKHWH